MFVGRKRELKLLENCYSSNGGKIAVLYGRRRIGKSTLIKKFAEQKSDCFFFEGIESENTSSQIKYFTSMLKKQFKDPVLESVVFRDWNQVFTYLTDRLINSRTNSRTILIFDEIQWLAAGRKALISILKYYWDNFWKEKNVMLILCGSIASFMVDKVLKSSALYGRIDLEILLGGLNPFEAEMMFSERKSRDEILKYMLVLGTVPKYLEYINQSKSFNKNINELFFSVNGKMYNEIERIFYSQFKESSVYQDIVNHLQTEISGLEEVSKKINIPNGGGLKRYLDNLENAEIIKSFIPYNKKTGSKLKRYALTDEYLKFYYKYVLPFKDVISQSSSDILFETLTKNSFEKWMGIQFEKFCLKQKNHLAAIMGFKNQVLNAAPYYERNDTAFQIDLLFIRSDNIVTICEIKYWNKPVGTSVIPEVKRKMELIPEMKGYSVETALIAPFGADRSLMDSKFFDHIVTLEQIFEPFE